MEKLTFEEIRKRGLLLYEYRRGSHAYGLNTETSDEDFGGVYMCPIEQLYDLGFEYQEQIANETNDIVWYELNKFMRLLLSSNPTVLESLFIPEDCIVYEHPIMTYIKSFRDQFITKQCFKSFGGYAVTQIEKARGLNKKIVNPITKRLGPLDFCYTFFKQGSTKIQNWLEYRNLKQQYCGLVNIPNMHDVYGCYYDWGNFFINENITLDKCAESFYNGDYENDALCRMISFVITYYDLHIEGYVDKTYEAFEDWFKTVKPIGYSGIVGEDNLSNELRLNSVSKGEIPICYISYNKTGYTKHCIDYKNYKDWEKHRNPVRYESNLNKNYDCYLDSETEFLTNNGWKKYDEITDNDLIGCFDDTHCIKYKNFKNRFSDTYTGKIYTYESPYIRFSITPNHKLYISPCHRTIYNNFSTKYDENRNDWKLITVDEYFNGKRSYYHQINHLNNNQIDNKQFSDDFIILLGLFLSEGCFVYNNKSKEPTGIRISQNEGRCVCDLIDKIKEFTISKYVYDKRKNRIENTYECNDKYVLNKFLECNGRYSTEKDIPNYVYSFSKRQFDLLLKSMLCGDGSLHKKGYYIYYTYSKKMAKTLHTLLMINGYNAQLYGGEEGYIYNRPNGFIRKDNIINGCYQVYISKDNKQYSVLNKKKNSWKIREVTNNRIVCFETEYNTIVTRNNGKMCFHGNSKNMMHSFRLINMCTEIANGNGFNCDRRNIDRDFLLDVKSHKYEYEEIMKMLTDKKNIMDEAIKNSKINENIDPSFVNSILINIRQKQINSENVCRKE